MPDVGGMWRLWSSGISGISRIVGVAAACWLTACASSDGGGRSASEPRSSLTSTGNLDGASTPPPAPTGPSLVVGSYNVNFGLAGDPSTLEAIAALDADALFLQETNEGWEESLGARFAADYPHQAFKHCCRAGGLGVLSRHPFEGREYVHPEGAWFPAWRVVADTPIGRLQVINVHLRPNFSDSGSVVSGVFTTPSVRLAEIERYAQLLEPGLPALVVGDFNESYEGLAVLHLRDLGMTSALAERFGLAPTWRWSTPLGQLRKQFDHIVVGPELTTLAVEVLEQGNSDHFPLRARLAARAP
jgi:endonuclease/exonuclease/phosphatase (EEP) superfamily protein YafD